MGEKTNFHIAKPPRKYDAQQGNIYVPRVPHRTLQLWRKLNIVPFALALMVATIWYIGVYVCPKINRHSLAADETAALPVWNRCESTKFSAIQTLEYNFTNSDTATKVWRFLDLTRITHVNNFRGDVYLQRNAKPQSSDIVIHVNVSSIVSEETKKVSILPADGGCTMKYESFGKMGGCTEAVVNIYLKAAPKRFLNTFEIRSDLLALQIQRSLNWELQHLILHSSFADVWYDGSFRGDDGPTTHRKLSVSTLNGTIGGNFVLDGIVDLKTVTGGIFATFGPRYYGSYSPHHISLVAKSGPINTRTYIDYWPYHPLNHTFYIHTDSGNINAGIPHGSFTNVTSNEGNIELRVLPFGTVDNRSEIHTTSPLGSTKFNLHNAPLESLRGYIDPLLRLVSTHRVGKGKLAMRYPYSWYGAMEARTGSGQITFDSSKLDELEQGEGYVRAKRIRDKKTTSVMDATVDDGDIDMILGL